MSGGGVGRESVPVLPSAGPVEPWAGRRGRSALHGAQEDAARQRRALREQLERVHRERTGRLRALRAR